MIALVMCGGKSSRMMQINEEKPLLKVNGMAMAQRVISALADSANFDRIIAAVSSNTPRTKEFLKSKGIETVETSGEGYSQDLSKLLTRLKPEKVMVFPIDLPLLNGQAVIDIVKVASKDQEPAVSIVLEKEFVENTGTTPSVVFGRFCHSGISLFDTTKVDNQIVQEHYVMMNRKEIAINVNTKEELELAEKLLVQRA